MRVGLVGLGRMGGAMGQRLATFGVQPLCWDQSEQASTQAAARGLSLASCPRAVAEGIAQPRSKSAVAIAGRPARWTKVGRMAPVPQATVN